MIPRPPRSRLRLPEALLLAATLTAPGAAQEGCPPGSPDAAGTHCAPLVPVPELRHVRASLELRPVPSPFGVAVTPDGRHRTRVLVHVEGLPEPADRDADAYVAWITDLALGSPERLGTVGEGTTDLGEVARNQFRILVSAEDRPDPPAREGPLVLRGTSPSVGLLAHRDAMIAAGLRGLGRESSPAEAGGPAWAMPPMRPGMGMGSMPGVTGRRPAVGAYLPGRGLDVEALPEARPRELLEMQEGDTLRLEAMLVRKRVGPRTLVMFAYNGQHPGPLIRVDQGATVTVIFANRIDHPSAVHWHGLRLENRYDGAPGVTQEPVEAGDDFLYRVHFPDAGIYWYHPHVREDVQQDLGLYGNMLVDPEDGSDLPPVDREVVLSLDDLLLTDDGRPVPWGEEEPVHALMGRFGNTFLVNGEVGWTMEATVGEVVRLHLTNVSNARTYNLSLEPPSGEERAAVATGTSASVPDAGPPTTTGPRTLPLKAIGSDVGLFQREERVRSVIIAPAERYTVDVRFDRPGRHLLLNRVQGVNHLTGRYLPLVDTLGSVVVRAAEATGQAAGHPASDAAPPSAAPSPASRAFDTLRAHPRAAADMAAVLEERNRPVDHRLELLLEATGPARTFLYETASGYAPPMEWNDGMPMMNWLTSGDDLAWTIRDPDTGLDDMEIDWRFRVGDVVKVAVTNRSDRLHPMNHPFHFHGQRFLVLSRNGVETANLVWKDTAVVGAGETVVFLVEMSNPGRWMAHCHIAEHLATGMMMTFQVDPAHR